MSAFMVSDATLVTIAAALEVTSGRPVDVARACETAKTLHAANVASLAARYPRQHGEMVSDAAPAVTLNDISRVSGLVRTAPGAVAKACMCFDYQACEVNDYEATPAAKITASICRDLIERLPGYEAAAWG